MLQLHGAEVIFVLPDVQRNVTCPPITCSFHSHEACWLFEYCSSDDLWTHIPTHDGKTSAYRACTGPEHTPRLSLPVSGLDIATPEWHILDAFSHAEAIESVSTSVNLGTSLSGLYSTTDLRRNMYLGWGISSLVAVCHRGSCYFGTYNRAGI